MNDVWTMDEKWGLTMYVNHNLANTLAARDYKQPQMVIIANSSGGGIAGTLDSNYFKGCGERQGVEREFVVITDEPIHRNDSGSLDSEV